ncbi:LecA/PA-IL family lectin [Streptomyces sp. SP18CS02]|uniref:LecA/PA-IL family lectin n=1 Tax=Streptomyces sp. SP18CS02 TaxID=3002531 RepID=UPI002E76E124|nr:LecA/PA-IL family lectin [Streptomyces sp. SP18CS02]MEE1751153.1 LecA/PA-IL family lectin [Streptomyces sp. SP18CS02]
MSNFNVVTVPAKTEGGVKSGVTVQRGEAVIVSGSGRASYNHGEHTTYPDGTRYNGGNYSGAYMQPDVVLKGAPVGMLIARIASGPWLTVGSLQTFVAQEDGEVSVAYNDKPGTYGDNSGEYTALIENLGRIS